MVGLRGECSDPGMDEETEPEGSAKGTGSKKRPIRVEERSGMSASFIDRRGSPLCQHPLERHEFTGSEFLCSHCHRPRALHYHDGFVPNHEPSHLSQDPACRYRGPHPRWTRPGESWRKDPPVRKVPQA